MSEAVAVLKRRREEEKVNPTHCDRVSRVNDKQIISSYDPDKYSSPIFTGFMVERRRLDAAPVVLLAFPFPFSLFLSNWFNLGRLCRCVPQQMAQTSLSLSCLRGTGAAARSAIHKIHVGDFSIFCPSYLRRYKTRQAG